MDYWRLATRRWLKKSGRKANGVYVVCSRALHPSRKSGTTKKCVLVTRTLDCRKDTRDDLDNKMPL